MEQYVIKGGNPLVGEVEIGGAKNAALAILAAAVMTDETVLIENMPDVRDTNVMLQAMESIGVRVERVDRHTVRINAKSVNGHVIEKNTNKQNEHHRKEYNHTAPEAQKIFHWNTEISADYTATKTVRTRKPQ